MSQSAGERDVAASAFFGALLEDNAEDLYDNAPCGYLSCLPDGTIVKVNQTFLTWTGHGRQELVGRTRFQDLLSVGGQVYYETHYGPLLQMQGAAREIAVEIVRADGGRLPALVNSVVTSDEEGRPAFVRTAVFDATERRAYERELLAARRRAEASEARARLLAHTLQQSLLPPALPEVPGLDMAAAYRPAGAGDEIGGDFYDVFETRGGDWIAVVGDVRGKGAEAAVVTALARYALRATAIRDVQPAKVLEALNEVLLREQGDSFCTLAYARLRSDPGRSCHVTVACGGHPPPIRVAPSGPLLALGRPGTLLGLLDTVKIVDVEATLTPGEALVFFTDGVTEARCDGEFFGEARLATALDAVRGEDAGTIARGLVDQVVAFQGGNPRDDIAVVVVKVRPEEG